MFFTVIAFKYALVVGQWLYGHFLKPIRFYLNNAIDLRIISCYTHKMASVSWPWTLWRHCHTFVPYWLQCELSSYHTSEFLFYGRRRSWLFGDTVFNTQGEMTVWRHRTWIYSFRYQTCQAVAGYIRHSHSSCSSRRTVCQQSAVARFLLQPPPSGTLYPTTFNLHHLFLPFAGS